MTFIFDRRDIGRASELAVFGLAPFTDIHAESGARNMRHSSLVAVAARRLLFLRKAESHLAISFDFFLDLHPREGAGNLFLLKRWEAGGVVGGYAKQPMMLCA